MRTAAVLGMMGLGLSVAAFAADRIPRTDPLVQRYLDCINSSARQQQEKDSDKITDAQAVIAGCAGQKEDMLAKVKDPDLRKYVAEIEKHLKTREKPQ